MSFIPFKFKGEEVIINTDRIVTVKVNSEKGLTVITCTDQIVATVDDSENEIKRKLGVKNTSEGVVGFKSV